MPPVSIHRIRLKGPWEVIPPGASDLDETRLMRLDVPCAWRDAFGSNAGTAQFRRRFHQPTNLMHDDRVLLEIPDDSGEVSRFSVNGQPIAPEPDSHLRFDVTTFLQPFNELRFEITFDPHASPDIPGGLWEAVYLEIRSAG